MKRIAQVACRSLARVWSSQRRSPEGWKGAALECAPLIKALMKRRIVTLWSDEFGRSHQPQGPRIAAGREAGMLVSVLSIECSVLGSLHGGNFFLLRASLFGGELV